LEFGVEVEVEVGVEVGASEYWNIGVSDYSKHVWIEDYLLGVFVWSMKGDVLLTNPVRLVLRLLLSDRPVECTGLARCPHIS